MAFTDTERLIGDAAKNQVAMNPTNTIFGKYSKLIKNIRRKYWEKRTAAKIFFLNGAIIFS